MIAAGLTAHFTGCSDMKALLFCILCRSFANLQSRHPDRCLNDRGRPTCLPIYECSDAI
jgi:hypothetical protein